MEFEGHLTLERPPSRRWVPIVAVVVPVATFVLVAAWFIRAYVAPPMAAVPSPMELAAIPAKPPARIVAKAAPPPSAPAAVMMPAAATEPMKSEPGPSATIAAAATSTAPVFASIAVAPPAMSANDQPTSAFSDPSADAATRTRETTAMAPAAAPVMAASEPIAGPIPLPPMRPRLMVAQVTGVVPLPRPRPTDAEPPPPEPQNSPAIYLHPVE